MKIEGSITALITPFYPDKTVNFEKLGELLEYQIQNRADAVLVLGTTGESSAMTFEEDQAVCRFAVDKVGGRIPVLAGSGSNCTDTMVKKSRSFERLGADGLLLISPYYNKTNASGMYRHFVSAADAVELPCFLYNIPGRTGCAIPLEVVRSLSSHPHIAGIKEASGDISYAASVARFLSEDFLMYSGNDDMVLPLMALGASGVISVSANIIPKETHDMVSRFLKGDLKGALTLQLRYLPLIHSLFCDVNPIPVKEALNKMGMGVGGYRLPLWEMSEEKKAALQSAMEEVELL